MGPQLIARIEEGTYRHKRYSDRNLILIQSNNLPLRIAPIAFQ